MSNVPDGVFGPPTNLAAEVSGEELLYFLLNVGDGDAQVLLLPENAEERRQVVVADVARSKKVLGLLWSVVDAGLLTHDHSIDLLIATHPHADHIRGVRSLLKEYQGRVHEVWSAGLHVPTPTYYEMLNEIRRQAIAYVEPSSGFRRYFDTATATVLSPGIGIKNSYYSYGLNPNSASICVKFEAPSPWIRLQDGVVSLQAEARRSLLLTGDASTQSWSHVISEFPSVYRGSNTMGALRATHLELGFGGHPLQADVLTIPHHGSKHGISLEVVEQIKPKVSLLSCGDRQPPHLFPHDVAVECIREGMQPTVHGVPRHLDHEIGIFYTSDHEARGPLGSIAVALGPSLLPRVWRFGDASSNAVNLSAARPRL